MTALGVGVGVEVGVRLELERLRITLHGRELLPPISAVVEAGRSLTVMGPSGSGKSTLLACIAGTLAPAFAYQGRVRVGTSNVTVRCLAISNDAVVICVNGAAEVTRLALRAH